LRPGCHCGSLTRAATIGRLSQKLQRDVNVVGANLFAQLRFILLDWTGVIWQRRVSRTICDVRINSHLQRLEPTCETASRYSISILQPRKPSFLVDENYALWYDLRLSANYRDDHGVILSNFA
jgi:hypothetical protein